MIRILVISILGLVAGAPLSQQQSSCEVCHLLVKELQDYLTTSQSKSSIENYVTDICSRLPGAEKDTCLDFTRNYAGSFFTKLDSDLASSAADASKASTSEIGTPSQFCENIPDVCPIEEKQDTNENVQGLVECKICELAVLGIDKIIKNNRSSAAINSTLEKFCNGLPAELSAPCKKIEPDILKGLKQGFDPKIACRFAKLCLVAEDDVIRNIPCDVCHAAIDAMGITDTASVCKHVEACETETETETGTETETETGTETETETGTEHQTEQEMFYSEPSVEADAGCEICELVVTFLDQLIADNATASTINTTLIKLCDSLPAIKPICLGAVPTIMAVLADGVDPKQACVATNFCPNATLSNSCDLCTRIADNNKDGKLNELVLDTTCTRLCHSRQRRSAPSFNEAELIEKMLKPCREEQTECRDAACDACKLIFSGIDAIVGSDITTGAINKTMTDICGKMAGDSIIDMCLKTVPKIVELLQNGVSPGEACKVAGLCSSVPTRSSSKRMAHSHGSKKIVHEVKPEPAKLTDGDDIECQLCKDFGKAIDFLLADNATTTEINSTLYNTCINLPADNLIKMCLNEMPKLLQALEHGVNVTELCIKAKMCPAYSTAVMSSEEKLRLKEPSSGSSKVNLYCDICEFTVEELDKVLDENTTREQINSTVYGVCDKLQGAFRDLCLQSAPPIVEGIANGVNPKEVCTLIKLCDAKHTLKETPKSEQVDLPCDICKFVIEELDKVLEENATLAKVNSTVYGVCAKLQGAFLDLCLQSAPKIVDAVHTGVDPKQVCDLVKLCTAGIDAGFQNQYPVSDNLKDIKCDICELAIKEIDSILNRNSTGQNINSTVYGVCGKLKGTLQTLCLNIAPDIVKAFEAGVDPEMACKILKICTSFNADTEFQNQYPVSDNLKDIKCDICELAIKEIDAILNRNSTGQNINSTVYGVCGKLKGTLQTLCLNIAPDIVKAFEAGVDPEMACEILKICTSFNADAEFQNQYPVSDNLKDLKCDICELAIKEIDAILQRNSTGQNINSTVYGVCDKLPGSLKTVCMTNAPQIVKALEAGVDPEQACGILRICTSSTAELDMSQTNVFQSGNLKDLKCDVCEFAVKEIDTILQKNGTGQDINATVFGVCGKLSGSLQSLCNTAAPEIVKALTSGVDPEEACEIIKICTSTAESMPILSETGGNLKDLKCDICEFAIKEIDAIIKRNGTGEDINSTVYGVCDKLPGSLQTLCYNMAPNVVKALSSGVDPEQACEAIKVCTSFDTNALLISKSEDNLKDIKCDICEYAIKEIAAIIKNESGGDYNSTVYGVCDKLTGVLKTFCDNYAPQIVKALESGVDPNKTCEAIKLCTSTEMTALQISQSENNLKDIKCDICEYAIKEIAAILKNESGGDYNSTVYGVCDKLTGVLKTFCDNYAPQIVKALESGVDPNKTCEAIKLCTSTEMTALQISQSENNLKDIKCDICEYAIKEIAAILKNESGGDYNSTVYGVCDKLTGVLKTFCDNYAPQIVKALESGVDPNKTCEAIKLCTSTEMTALQISQSENNLKDIKCDICEFAIKEIAAILKNESGGDYNSTVYGVCDKLTGVLKTFCDDYAPQIVKALESGVEPNKTCAAIKLCSSTEMTALLISKSEDNLKDIKCDICEFAIKEIAAILKNESGGDYNSTVYGVCDKLTGVLKTFCYEYAPQIVKALESGVEPNKTCAAIKLCSSTAVNTVNFELSGKQPLDCIACQNSLQDVYSNVQQDYPKVQRVLTQLCERLSPNLQYTCKTVLQADNGVFFKTLLQSYTPVLMCEMAECVEG